MDIHQQDITICSLVIAVFGCCPLPAQCCRCHALVWSCVHLWWHHCHFTNILEVLGHLSPPPRNIINYLSFSADDDSEPILGLWFEETISPTKDKVAPPPPPPPPPLETSPRLKSPSKQNPSENGNILAGRKDPELVRAHFCIPM